MVCEELIKRVPIKLRNSIKRDYCTCWGSIITSEGLVHFMQGDDIFLKQLVTMNDVVKIMPAIGFMSINKNIDKIRFCLSHRLPIILFTDELISDDIIKGMKQIPKCSVFVNLNNVLKEKSLHDKLEHVARLQENMALCKKYWIYVGAYVSYNLLAVRKLDLYEIIDKIKNQISQLFLDFTIITDEYYVKNMKKFDSVKCIRFGIKTYYTPVVQNRCWIITEQARELLVEEIEQYLKYRGIKLKLVDIDNLGKNHREYLTESSDNLFGAAPGLYTKLRRHLTHKLCRCPQCKKLIY